MAHQIEEHDKMFSVEQRPWHGLGNVIEKYPTIAEAKKYSGLDWDVTVEEMEVTYNNKLVKVPNNFAVVREDIEAVIGVVGNRYVPYQNSEMWGFIDDFQKQSGVKLETAGSLKNGTTTWVLAKNGIMETVKGDEIEEFFLFRNSFDGSSNISCLFTNIRVVCANTLTAAIKGATNIYNVRHTASASEQIKQVQKALGVRAKYQSQVKVSLELLAKHQMDATATERFLKDVVFPKPKKIVQTVGQTAGNPDPTFEFAEASKRAMTTRANNVQSILELVEDGRGTHIKGVKGTAYGLWNALTEWADHEKSVRVLNGRDEAEVRFENAFFGTGSKFKQETFKELVKLAA